MVIVAADVGIEPLTMMFGIHLSSIGIRTPTLRKKKAEDSRGDKNFDKTGGPEDGCRKVIKQKGEGISLDDILITRNSRMRERSQHSIHEIFTQLPE